MANMYVDFVDFTTESVKQVLMDRVIALNRARRRRERLIEQLMKFVQMLPAEAADEIRKKVEEIKEEKEKAAQAVKQDS
jgi:hypothetical protein